VIAVVLDAARERASELVTRRVPRCRARARLGTAARCDGEYRRSLQVRIKQLEDVSLARSCRRLPRLFPVATRALPPVATDRE
jgi:hypothetical protein